MIRKVNFTKALLSSMRPSKPGERLVLIDTKIPGLQCRINHTGVVTFSVYRRIKSGRPERITLGRLSDITVEQARVNAEKINACIASGNNPAEVKRAHRSEITFKELFEQYLERHSKWKKRSWQDDRARYRLYLEKPLGNKKLSHITRLDIASIHSGITKQMKEKGKSPSSTQYKSGATANRVLALVSVVFNWGISTGLCENNPARGIKKNTEKSRERFLQPEELAGFLQSVREEESDDIRDYVMLSLFTGARRSNVLSMKWEQVSFQQKLWCIPHSKNNESVLVPLVDEVMDILKGRKDNESEYVFPAKGKTGHLQEPWKGWQRILKRAGIKDLRLHDLRRTMGSWQAITGSSTIIIGKSLGHKSQQATAIYARLHLDPVRRSIETATAAIMNAAQQ